MVKKDLLSSQARCWRNACTIRTGTRVGTEPRQPPTVIWEDYWALDVVKSRHGPLELVVVNGDLGTSRLVAHVLLV